MQSLIACWTVYMGVILAFCSPVGAYRQIMHATTAITLCNIARIELESAHHCRRLYHSDCALARTPEALYACIHVCSKQ